MSDRRSQVAPDKGKVIGGHNGKTLPRQNRDPVCPTTYMKSVEGKAEPIDLRACTIWGDGQTDDLLRLPGGRRFARGYWREHERKYVVNPANHYEIWEISPDGVIEWCNARGYAYPDPSFIPVPSSAAAEAGRQSDQSLEPGSVRIKCSELKAHGVTESDIAAMARWAKEDGVITSFALVPVARLKRKETHLWAKWAPGYPKMDRLECRTKTRKPSRKKKAEH